ncbi:MAG: hypothetical protein ACLS5Z_06385 [Clostridium fessum]
MHGARETNRRSFEVDRRLAESFAQRKSGSGRSYGSDNTSEDEDAQRNFLIPVLDAMPEDDVKSAAWLADSATAWRN